MSISNKTEETVVIKEVVKQVQAGDTYAYTEIIRCFQKQIYLYCYYLLGNKEEAEDASQDVFIKGLENIRQFTYSVSFSAWLYKIAHHHCIDLLKKKNKGFRFWTGFKKEQMVEQSYESYHYEDSIHQLLEKLNADEKRILLLRSIEEYSFDEIASIMDLKPATVRKKYERLRKKLLKEKKQGRGYYERSIKTEG
ncbi:RNA polymerase sigma factor [Lysinibacillus sp. FSL M8-0216]|uniref:RNA polymerase sigma factor n=1 Tax=unclassified Lysinibacillus TaxID=2636778 RepID=UPI003159B719